MPYFVEYLRATRALRIAVIVLAVLLVVGIAFRLYFLNGATPQAFAASLESSPTAHVTRTQLADGGTRTVVDDPALRRHAVIVRHGEDFTLQLDEPRGSAHERVTVAMGNTSTMRENRGATDHTTMTYQRGTTMDWGMVFLVTAPMGLLIATMLGGPLSKENNGHLELAWTKPVSREAYALAAVAIDALAIVAAQLATLVVIVVGTSVWAVPTLTAGPEAGARIALALLGPLAWYACLTAFSASFKRGPGPVIGVAWVIAIVIPALASWTHDATDALLSALHGVFAAVMYADPIAYIWFQRNDDLARATSSTGALIAWLGGLAVVYVALAVAQWRRIEA